MKLPMTPAEFDARKREFEKLFDGMLHQTSGRRTQISNRIAGGADASKHLLGMAVDYRLEPGSEWSYDDLPALAADFGFWFKVYDWPGIHLQGLPPGEVPEWWAEKYG